MKARPLTVWRSRVGEVERGLCTAPEAEVDEEVVARDCASFSIDDERSSSADRAEGVEVKVRTCKARLPDAAAKVETSEVAPFIV